MTPEAINAYFTPLDYVWYLLAIFVVMVVYYQWRWSRTCKTKVLVLVQKADGHGDYELADQSGGSVSLKDPHTNTVRLWPINELATISVPYPGVGFVPTFLQKTIRMVIVSEDDWEPLTNRGSQLQGVASRDVVGRLTEIMNTAESSSPTGTAIKRLLSGITISSIREMIASPAVLGNLMHEKITEAVITVNKEMLDSISGLTKRLNKVVSPLMFYIGTGVLIAGMVFMLWQVIPVMSDLGDVADKLDAIQKALGIVSP